MPVIDSVLAREYAARSVAARKLKRELASQMPAQTAPETAPISAQNDSNPVAKTLLRVFDEKLALLDSATDPKEVAILARGLKDIREAWHSVTGVPRPGLSRTDAKPQRNSWYMPRPTSAAPEQKPIPALPSTPSPTPSTSTPESAK